MPTPILAKNVLVYGRRDERLHAYTINWHYFVPGRSDAQRSLRADFGPDSVRFVPEADIEYPLHVIDRSVVIP